MKISWERSNGPFWVSYDLLINGHPTSSWVIKYKGDNDKSNWLLRTRHKAAGECKSLAEAKATLLAVVVLNGEFT